MASKRTNISPEDIQAVYERLESKFPELGPVRTRVLYNIYVGVCTTHMATSEWTKNGCILLNSEKGEADLAGEAFRPYYEVTMNSLMHASKLLFSEVDYNEDRMRSFLKDAHEEMRALTDKYLTAEIEKRVPNVDISNVLKTMREGPGA